MAPSLSRASRALLVAAATTAVGLALTTTGGCGGLTLVDEGDGGGTGRRSDAGPPTPTPKPLPPQPLPPQPVPPPTEPTEPASGCPSANGIDATNLPYHSPFVSAGSCTTADLTALGTYVDNGGTFPDWKTSVSPTCAGCIFGSPADVLWKPMLENGAALVDINVGGCIAIASGSDACGRAYQQWFECRPEACAGCPDGDAAALQKCLAAASKGACKKAFDAVGTICGDQVIGDAENACDGSKYLFEGPIRAQCIGL